MRLASLPGCPPRAPACHFGESMMALSETHTRARTYVCMHTPPNVRGTRDRGQRHAHTQARVTIRMTRSSIISITRVAACVTVAHSTRALMLYSTSRVTCAQCPRVHYTLSYNLHAMIFNLPSLGRACLVTVPSLRTSRMQLFFFIKCFQQLYEKLRYTHV